MSAAWKGRYTDAFGQEAISIHAEDRSLSVQIRGVTFTGLDFDDLEAPADLDPAAQFDLRNGSLCRYNLRWDTPIQIDLPSGEQTSILHCQLTLDLDHPDHASREKLTLSLHDNGAPIQTSGNHAFFEDALADLQRQLPEQTTIRACISCAYSDYYPAGSSLSGTLACFSNVKAAYQLVTGKRDIFRLWPSHAELVRETHLCPEYARRGPHACYRGGFPDP